jgi:uncharacterized protein
VNGCPAESFKPGGNAMSEKHRLSRRSSLKGLGVLGAAALCTVAEGGETSRPPEPPKQTTDIRKKIFSRVSETPLIDTHEHLCEEPDRLSGKDPFGGADDWSALFSHYLSSDLLTAGMPPDDHGSFFSANAAPAKKWRQLEPYWPAVKNTGYGRTVRIAMRELYGVEELSAATVDKVQAGYAKLLRPGFYRHVLSDLCKIESCQVNSLSAPFCESQLPTLLMQDLSLMDMFVGPNVKGLADRAGIKVSNLADWHRVIDWWFEKYGRYAVAVKSQNAYSRDIDYRQVDAETVEKVFQKKIKEESPTPEEQKKLEDHLFWYAVRKATACRLPVKLHTGYYAGENYMPLSRLAHNANSAGELCRTSPETRFVFMHINYPYYEDLIAVAKHYTNAYVDLCWSWIINPVATKDFLKKYLVTAPANKILTFGGDYLYVELVLGHASIARQGIALALSELVEEGWCGLDDALELVDPIMHGNARRIFHLEEKQKLLKSAPWLGSGTSQQE